MPGVGLPRLILLGSMKFEILIFLVSKQIAIADLSVFIGRGSEVIDWITISTLLHYRSPYSPVAIDGCHFSAIGSLLL